MIIPIDALEADTLYSLAESFVLREGTDYGAEEVALDVKVQQVLNRLKSGEAVLVYSELHESVDIKRKEDIEPSESEEQWTQKSRVEQPGYLPEERKA